MLCLLAGCTRPAPSAVASSPGSTGPAAPGSASSPGNLPLLAVIGKSIGLVAKAENITFDKQAFVIDGPNKGMPVGVKGKTAGGDEVRLYFTVGPRSGEETPDWQLDDFSAVTITGVAVKQNGAWRSRGAVREKLE